MIVSFGSKETEKIGEGERVRKIPLEIQQIGKIKRKGERFSKYSNQ